tara:strand:- start:1814 stop:3265 length:1452 start_codon:yes stop_codon:yes gene_type:complete
MTYKNHIRYHKWEEKEYKELFNSVKEHLEMKSLQFYMPFYSLYFSIHNNSRSLLKMDLERNFYIRNIKDITKSRYYNSNMFLVSNIYDSSKNIIEEKEIFCKTIPIVDIMHCINDNYNFITKNNYHLPSAYNYNTFKKINDMNNTAYIDVFCSYLFGNLTYNKINPSFALYYGSMNGIGDYKYDISEEYHDIKNDKCFNKCIDKGFKLDVYISDSDNDSDNESENDTDNDTDNESVSELDSETNEDDYIVNVKDIPLQLLCIEKLEGTLEDLIDDNISEELILSCIFQISFALTYLQKHFDFTHNDLHINNIMYSNTETKYLYYKLNNIYYRVPTHGKIFKIIDFGRAIFKYKNKVFMNDVFSKLGEAGGQYSYPSQVDFLCEDKEEKIIKPNPNFDLCRLSMTILEEIDPDSYSDKLLDFLIHMCDDDRGENFCNMRDDFKLYMDIAKYACNSLPREIILHNIFKDYRVTKSVFPRKSYYTL